MVVGFTPRVYALSLPASINPSLVSSTANCTGMVTQCIYTVTVGGTQYYGSANSTGVSYGFLSTLYPNEGGATGTNFTAVYDSAASLGGIVDI